MKLIINGDFILLINAVESAAWCSYISVVKEFISNNKVDNYHELVEIMLTNFQALGTRMNIEVQYLFRDFDFKRI